MLAGTNIVAEGAVQELAGLGHLLGPQAVGAEQMINRSGGAQHFELSRRTRPGALRRVGQQDWPRCAQRDQVVLIEGQAVRLFVEFLELGVEPMREVIVDLLDRLADLTAARRDSAAANLQRNYERDAFVKRAG